MANISKIKLPNNVTYDIDAVTVNGKTVETNVPSNAVFTDNDTKNTAGSTDTSSKIYIIGATTQAANPQTYSQDTAYVGTDGCLYSGGNKVLTSAPVTSVAGKTGAVTLTASDVGAASSTHTHGNIQNGGTLQTTDVTIANGDKLVVTDNSDSNKVARTSVAFDGSTATKCLTQKGTWESFSNNAGTVTSVKVGTTSYDPSSGVVSLPAYPTTLPASDVSAWAKASTKPTYTASEVGAIATTAKGANGGVAELDANGKVPTAQLPSYVDDVLEYTSKSSFPTTGETGKIYVDTTTNLTYRWSGTAYVEISPSLALGETSSTAYYGDKGKTAYDHSQVTSGNPHNVTASDVGLGNVGNFKAVSTVASQGLTSTEQANARANIGAGTSSFSGSYADLSNKPTLGTAAAKDSTTSVTSGSNDLVTSGAVYTAIQGAAGTTYTFAEGTTNGAFKVTPSGGTAQSVPVHGVLTSHQSVTDNNPTLSWGTKSKVATIGSTDINVTMPSNPASGKQDTITGGATTITSSNLTTNRALVSNASGKVAVSDVTSTELGYLDGLDRNVMGFYTAKTYNYNISNDDMRGISGQYERNGAYWINVENWLGTMPPSGNYGYFEVMGNLQRFTPYSSEGSSTVYTRTYVNSAWSDWTVINNPKYNTDLYRKITTVTVGKSSDNGVTSTKTPGYAIVDFNEKVYAKFTGYANTNGVTAARIGAVNTKTDGTDVTNYLYVGVRKNGDCYYSVTDDAQFRSDLGIQATITGAASTITSNNLDTSRALISNSNGKVSVSSTTSTELARLSGVTSNVQTQLDNRLTLSGGTITGNLNRQLSSSITIGKTSNNGVSSDTYGGFFVTDSNDYYFTRVRGAGYTDGRVAAVLESRNMKTNGDAITNIFVVGVKKNGDYYYKVTSPTAFREAIRTVTDISSTLVKDEASVANSSSKSNKGLGSFTVAPGTWLITYTVRFADNSTGDRFTMITETNSTSADSVGFKFTCDMQANTNKPTYCRATGIYYNTTGADKTLYIRGYQNSGSTLKYSTYVDLVCLRPTITD